MRILHLATYLQGGAGRVIVDLAIDQHRGGHEVAIVTSRTAVPGYGHYGAYIEELTAAGVELRLVDSLFTRDHAANVAVVQALTEHYAPGQEPAIVHAHAAIPSLIGLLFAGARARPIPVVQTMHGWGVTKTPGQAAADVSLMNLVSGVVVPSQHSAGLMASLGVLPDRLVTIPYGVGRDRVAPEPRDKEVLHAMSRAREGGAMAVVCVGTVGPRKNQTLLVEALRRIGSAASIALWIIGDGDTGGLQAAISAMGLDRRIRLHGYSRAARSLAAGADVLVLPSRSEGQPISILEAYADGTLVVVSDIPELAELVEDGDIGTTFHSDDATSLAGALVGLAKMPESEREARRARARQVQESRYTTSTMAQQYLDFYYRRLAVMSRSRVSSAA